MPSIRSTSERARSALSVVMITWRTAAETATPAPDAVARAPSAQYQSSTVIDHRAASRSDLTATWYSPGPVLNTLVSPLPELRSNAWSVVLVPRPITWALGP